MSKIQWTGKTLNLTSGCDKISPGCENCYAIPMAYRLIHIEHSKEVYAGVVAKTKGGKLNWTGKINLHVDRLLIPLKVNKPTLWFVDSMADLFHKDVPVWFIAKVWAMMFSTSLVHTYQILTKRAQRAVEILNSSEFLDLYYDAVEELYRVEGPSKAFTREDIDNEWPLKNVWIGTSVEDQKRADERIPHLLHIPAHVRFLSCEPLLGPVDLRLSDKWCNRTEDSHECEIIADHLHWVIVGGESGGSKSRPMHPDWARSLRDQCYGGDVKFFFKQWGQYYTDYKMMGGGEPTFKMYTSYQHFANKDWVMKGDKCISIDGTECKVGKDFMDCAYPVAIMQSIGKDKAGRLLDGRTWDEMPEREVSHE